MSIGTKTTVKDKVLVGLIVSAGIVLLAALTQPAWRGEAMVGEMRSDCNKRGGVMLEHAKTFGTSYECASRLD